MTVNFGCFTKLFVLLGAFVPLWLKMPPRLQGSKKH